MPKKKTKAKIHKGWWTRDEYDGDYVLWQGSRLPRYDDKSWESWVSTSNKPKFMHSFCDSEIHKIADYSMQLPRGEEGIMPILIIGDNGLHIVPDKERMK